MPRLKKILIRDFRNIGLQEVSFSPKINCISGGNGEGKTNLLDAVWYLSMTKSSLSSAESHNFRYGTSAFAIIGLYSMENGTESRFSVQVSRSDNLSSDKVVRRDEKPYRKVSEHIGVLPVVMVSPADSLMISDSGEGRRKFANSVLSQMSCSYLSDIQQYNRFLLQRNKLLKAGIFDESLIESLDEGLEKYARPIYESRYSFSESMLPIVREYYGLISGGRETIGMEYRSCLHKGDLCKMLRHSRAQDMAMKYTTVGLQRDDFIFTMDGHPIRHGGSQGQQKSFLVALKFAQYDFMAKSYGFKPILLLDDLFDKLDMSRVSNLLSMVSSNSFGQIFLTDSNKTRIKDIVDALTEDRVYYDADSGAFAREYE